ncbi:MAG: HD domain-containing protein [Chloroflexi bacterium]|nr:HD domain-containing protein [Chloroflexota bacterium]
MPGKMKDNKKTILIAASDPYFHTLCHRIFKSYDAQIIDVSSGKDFMGALENEKADFVLFHDDMPDDKILRKLKELKREPGGLKIISFSAVNAPSEFPVDKVMTTPVEIIHILDLAGEIFTGEKPRSPSHRELELSRMLEHELRSNMRLRDLHGNILHNEKLKDQLYSLITSRMQEPIDIVGNFASLMDQALKHSEASPSLIRLSEEVHEADQTLSKLVDDLSEYTEIRGRQHRIEMTEVSLPLFMESLLKEIKPVLEKGNHGLELRSPDDLPTLKFEPESLRQALSLMITRLLTHIPRGENLFINIIPDDNEVKVEFSFTGMADHEAFLASLEVAVARYLLDENEGRFISDKAGRYEVVLSVFKPGEKAYEALVENREFLTDLARSLSYTEKHLLRLSQNLARLYEQESLRTKRLQGALDSLEQTYLQTVAAMAQVVDKKDSYTGSHTDRVSYFATVMAEKIDPSLINTREFKYGLLLHDIGKIGIAEEILGKAEKLTPQEWEQIKSHPAIGTKLLAPIEFLNSSLAAVRWHHERWDGKGYPDGLKGEEIPLLARLIALADAFDAMISDRPYRKGLSINEAKNEIIRQSGKQFDPMIVNAFLDSWDEVEKYFTLARSLSEQDLPESTQL